MTDKIQDLLKIKEHVDKAKQQRTNLEGQLEQIHKRFKDEFGCASAAEAQKYVDELEVQAVALDKEITEGVADLKGELGW
jgi:hypothetical protein